MSDRLSISPYPIRMPSDLRTQLELCAKQGARSLHSEIIHRLVSSFDPISSIPPEIKQAIEQKADKAKHPVLVEVEARLQATLEQDQLIGKWSEGDHGYESAVEWLVEMREEVKDLERQCNELENNPIILDGAELAQGVERRLREYFPAVLQILDFQGPAHRLRCSGSTQSNIADLMQCFDLLRPITAVIFAVRPGRENRSALTVAIQTEVVTVVADRLYLTIERPPREAEVQDLFRRLDAQGLFEGASRFVVERIGETEDLDANAVWRYLNERDLQVLSRRTLPNFLGLFFDGDVKFDDLCIGKYLVQ